MICSPIFLGVSKAFHKVCHSGLIYILNKHFSNKYVQIIKSYLEGIYFRVKQQEAFSNLKEINTGVPQRFILGPILYLLHTRDIPVPTNTTVATFADDTAILSVAESKSSANTILQNAMNEIAVWTKAWRIELNNTKSVHINFTNKKTNNLPIYSQL
ncbi:putative RNA-directed DNA polymerase from transposon X-element [Lucilia cuprina]|nr:putative RNA-directed DNA polymerase from transposon X-element [Lucilia cuprina]